MARSSRKKKGRKKKGLVVNFDEVEVGGRNVPDGTYKVRFDSYEEEEGNDYPYWACKFKVVGGSHDGAILYDNISHSPAAHFKIAQLMRCLGFELPEGEESVDAEDFLEEEGTVEVINEEYDGKDKPRIVEYLVPVGDEDTSFPSVTKKKKRKKKKRTRKKRKKKKKRKRPRRRRRVANPEPRRFESDRKLSSLMKKAMT
jgi:hypothetical protein